MRNSLKCFLACGLWAAWGAQAGAQSFTWYASTEGNTWQTSTVKLSKKAAEAQVTVDDEAGYPAFKAWAATFNELDWDALGVLTRAEQDEILYVFSRIDNFDILSLGFKLHHVLALGEE